MKENSFLTKMAELNGKVQMQKSTFPKILALVIILLLVGFYFFSNLEQTSKFKIGILMEKNNQLLNDNKKLDSTIVAYQLELSKKNIEIEHLQGKDYELQKSVKTLENKIKILKVNYEKANNHADNFSSDQLSRYFADSLR